MLLDAIDGSPILGLVASMERVSQPYLKNFMHDTLHTYIQSSLLEARLNSTTLDLEIMKIYDIKLTQKDGLLKLVYILFFIFNGNIVGE